MNDIERGCLESVLGIFPARIAGEMRSIYEQEQLLDGKQQLTPVGKAWVQGFVAAQLVAIRGMTTGNPNLSNDDMGVIKDLVAQHESEIAAQLFA